MAGSASSSTSSPTSTSSSTSDRRSSTPSASIARRLGGLIRLVHPFPILLDAIATGAIAAVAGGGLPRAAHLAVGMLALQASIGALNDVVDAERDAGHKPGKPIPAGLIGRRLGLAVAVASALAGLALSFAAGLATGLLGLVILAVGATYDLRLKGTALSWLPFAVGIPLLPVYAWVGATGALPPMAGLLLPAAVLAGTALALGNTLVDTERDRAAGVSSVAVALGEPRAWALHAVIHACVLGLAFLGALQTGANAAISLAAVAAPGVLLATGIALTRASPASRRERGWELEAIAVALLAATWTSIAVASG